jgi:hypothetical protein
MTMFSYTDSAVPFADDPFVRFSKLKHNFCAELGVEGGGVDSLLIATWESNCSNFGEPKLQFLHHNNFQIVWGAAVQACTVQWYIFGVYIQI